MRESGADREELMKAIKHELSSSLWSNPRHHPTYGRYLSLFHLNTEAMWVYDTHTLGILDVNDAAIRRYGYTKEEFLGKTVKDLRPPEDVPKFLELIPGTPNSDRTGPWRHVLKDGTVIQVLITSHSVRYGDRDARLVMAENLTADPDIDLD